MTGALRRRRLCRLLTAALAIILSDGSHAMNSADAIRLAQAWAYNGRSGAGLTGLKVEFDGSFETEMRGASLRYSAETGMFRVSGLVGGHAAQLKQSAAAWQKLQMVAAREAATMGEGSFELSLSPVLNAEPPVLLLSKTFADGGLAEMQFIIEVRWLLEWATHWRKVRLWEVFSGRDEQTVEREGKAHVERALKLRPRPW